MHPLLRKWFMIFVAFLMLGVVGAAVAVGALLGYIDQMPPLTALEHYSPPEVTRYFDRTGNTQMGEDFSERREVVRYKDIPEHVINAFIAIEDERFYSHFGIDIKGLIRSINTDFHSGAKAQGASTITMQVARNVVLQDTRKNYGRKIKEILTSLQIERHYSKEQILEFYLNQIYFGNHAYGIQAASKAYFNKDVKDLTVPEAAMLAGLPKAPSNLSPFRNIEAATDRRNLVLNSMRRLNYIKTDDELNRYLAQPIVTNAAPHTKTIAPYYVDYIRMGLMKDNSMQSSNELGDKGYTIVSSCDLALQKICEEELSKGLREVEKDIQSEKPDRQGIEASELGGLKKGQARLARINEVKEHSIIVSCQGMTGEVPLPDKLPYFNPDAIIKKGNLIDIYIQDIRKGKLDAYLYDKAHVQGGVVLLDAHTGEILALVGGDDFDDPVNNGQWNRAVQGGRQPGSCWKPLLYASSFDVMNKDGKPRFTPGSIEVDEPITIGNWSPKNYEKGRYFGPTCLFEALVKSRNIPTVRLFMDIGPKNVVPLYQRFNVVNTPSNWVLDPYPPMALGTPNITPLELAGAYSVLDNHGLGIKPRPIKRIYSPKNPSDSTIPQVEQTQVISPEAAYMTARIMQHVITMGTAKTTIGEWYKKQVAKGIKMPEMAGKTGTTNDCYTAWFSGFTPDLVLTIYVSYDQFRTLGPKMVGGHTVGPIWAPTMERILATRSDWKMKFDVPAGLEFRDICAKSGQKATESCYSSGDDVFTNAAFKKGTAPNENCSYHGGGSYNRGDGDNGDVESQYDTGRGTSIGDRGEPVSSGYNNW